MMMTPLLRGTAMVVLVLTLAACSHSTPPAPPPPTVQVMTAQPQTVSLTQDFVGRLTAFRNANVVARVAGVLLKRTYKEGSEVKKGQLLFQIDPAPFRATLANANAQLAQAKAAYVNARVNAQRDRTLAPKGYISQMDLDNAEAAERTSKAGVQAAKANVQTAQINLGYTKVTSPIAGRAGEQQVTEGALVGQGTATLLTTISQVDPLYVNFTISISQLDELRQADRSGAIQLAKPNETKIQLTLPDGTSYRHVAVLDFSSPTVDPSTGAVKLRALVPNPEFTLMPGTYVTLKVDMGQRNNAFLIPQTALQRDIKGPYVLAVDKDNKVVQLRVATDGTKGNDWLVTQGIPEGARIIVSGIQSAHVGAPVKVVPQPSSGDHVATTNDP